MPSTTCENAKAVFWLPSDPNNKLQGEINYGCTSGAEVDLFGQFHDCFSDNTVQQRFVLFGETFDAKPFSLFQAFVRSANEHSSGGASCKISSINGIIGGHFASEDEVFFKTLRVELQGLVEWVCATGISWRHESGPTFTTTCKPFSAIPLGSFRGFTLSIETAAHIQPDFHRITIEEVCTLVIEAESEKRLDDFEGMLRGFQFFLSLAVQRPVHATSTVGHRAEPDRIVSGTPIFRDFPVVQKARVEDWKDDKLLSHELLFGLPHLQPTPTEMLERFLTRRGTLRPAMDLYFSTIYSRSPIPRVEFLTLAQAVESYHRITIGGQYVTDDVYASLKNEIWQTICRTSVDLDADFKVSLRNKLNYLHEFSLRKRIRDLVEKHDAVLHSLLGKASEFASKVADLRNQLTHVDSGREHVDWKQIWHLSQKLGLLLEVCFLDEIGFSIKTQQEIVSERSSRARRIWMNKD